MKVSTPGESDLSANSNNDELQGSSSWGRIYQDEQLNNISKFKDIQSNIPEVIINHFKLL